MTEADALAQYPTATRVPGTIVIRELPETEDEAFKRSTTALSQRLPGYRQK